MNDNGTGTARNHPHHRHDERAVAPTSGAISVGVPFRGHSIGVMVVAADGGPKLWFAAVDVWRFLNAGTELEGTLPPLADIPSATTLSLSFQQQQINVVDTNGFYALGALGMRLISHRTIDRWIARRVQPCIVGLRVTR